MATISSPGLGSGLDVSSIVSQLIAVEGRAPSQRLNIKESRLQATLSSLSLIKGALSDFNSKLASLSNAASFQGRVATSSDETVFKATATNAAAVGNYDISISQLAKAHTLVTKEATPFTSTTDAVGTGTITIKFGTGPIGSFVQNANKGTYTITVDSSNNSLEGIKDAINELDADVRASIINNGSGYLLSLTSTETGAENSMEITIDDTGDAMDNDDQGLSRLAYNSAGSQLEEKTTAQDASLTIDGVTVTSKTNTISTAIEGLTLNLLDAKSGTLDVSLNRTNVVSSVEDFVNSFNSMIATVTSQTKYDPETKIAGILNGDAGVASIVSRIRSILGGSVKNLSGPYSSMADLGITTQSDGTLKLDSTKLNNVLDSNYDDVVDLFAAIGNPDDSLINYTSSTDDTITGIYDVDITTLATQGNITGTSGLAALKDDSVPGTFDTAFVVDTDNDTFKIMVDGVESNEITLTNKSYTTTASLISEIQSRINADTNLKDAGISVSVTFNADDSITITSDRYGSASKVEFTQVDTNSAAELGFSTVLAGTDGVDVAGTIGGLSAIGSGQFLTGNTGAVDGLKIEITGGSTGSRGTIAFTRGIADQLNDYLSSLFDNEVFDDRIEGINTSIKDIESQREALDRRLASREETLLAKFSALDVMIAEMNSTSQFLTTQLARLPTIGETINKSK